MAGVVVVAAGPGHAVWGFGDLAHGHMTGVTKLLLALVLSPIIGFWAGYLLHSTALFLLRAARPTFNRYLRGDHYVTAADLAFFHGANDAQKSMGMLTLALLLGGFTDDFVVPFWVSLACSCATNLGILSGGWRIVPTLSFAIYKVRPLHALDSQLTSAGIILAASLAGAPVSTTHVVASSIMGMGASERPKAVRWAKVKEIVKTWVITIPGAAAASVAVFLIVRFFLHV